ncbi:hypothetical protein MP228_002805 [Amoeboaphelidium protococcarum]|nr:hypothetical protein MP228_002805 [Amoeboaphelidium protococcarum]
MAIENDTSSAVRIVAQMEKLQAAVPQLLDIAADGCIVISQLTQAQSEDVIQSKTEQIQDITEAYYELLAKLRMATRQIVQEIEDQLNTATKPE